MNFARLVPLVLLALLAAPVPALAAGKVASAPQQLTIVAKSSEYDGETHTYLVQGDVRIAAKGLLVTCDRATIFSTPKEDRIERIVFDGNVQAHRGRSTFTGAEVTLYVPTQRLVAEGGTKTRIQLPAPLVTPAASPNEAQSGNNPS